MSTTANAKVVEHTAARYDDTDTDPQTHMPSEKVPKFRLKPKNEHAYEEIWLANGHPSGSCYEQTR